MEKPYTGRTTVADLYNGAEIIILPFQQAILWLQAAVFVGFFSLFSYYILFGKATPGASYRTGYPVYAIYAIIIVGLITVAYSLWWTIKGKEVVTLTDGVLTITKVNSFEKTKSYDMRLATNFRAVEEEVRRGRNFGRLEGYAWQVAMKGTIRFDYDVVETIQFGDWLPQAEGEYILERLRDKKLIS
jgi:hypothetical protein